MRFLILSVVLTGCCTTRYELSGKGGGIAKTAVRSDVLEGLIADHPAEVKDPCGDKRVASLTTITTTSQALLQTVSLWFVDERTVQVRCAR